MKELKPTTVILVLAMALGCIGLWLFFLAAEPVATVTREGVVLYKPSNFVMVVTVFVMLTGVVLASIQIAWLLERWLGREE